MISEAEIGGELVLTLLPEILVRFGATATCSRDRWVTGRHTFLCLEADEEIGRWLPLFSNSDNGRIPLPEAGRIGHSFWTKGRWHYHPEQVWFASHVAVIAAAVEDRSASGARNMLNTRSMPQL